MLLRKLTKNYLLFLLMLLSAASLQAQSGKIDIDFKTIDPSACDQSDGAIHITPLTGVPPFRYSINGGAAFQRDSIFANLGIGTYIIVVIDGELEFSSFFLAKLEAEGSAIINGIVMADPTECGMGGTIKILAEGDSTLQYSIDSGATFQPSPIFSDVSAGTYNIAVSNGNEACVTTYPTVSFAPQPPSNFIDIMSTVTQPTCDTTNGMIRIQVTGGSGDYLYSINDGQDFQSTAVFDSLSAGTYNIVVRDTLTKCDKAVLDDVVLEEQGCPNCDSLLISFTPVQPNCDSLNGTITVAASGGSGNYKYSIDAGESFQTSPNFSNLAAGNYTLVVQDVDNNCTKNVANRAILAATDCPNCDSIAIQSFLTLPSCDSLNGRIELSISGGSGNYSVQLDSGQFTTMLIFPNLGAGSYTFTVRDSAMNCEKTFSSIELQEEDCSCALAIFDEHMLTDMAQTCQQSVEICLDYPLESLMKLEILDNGTAYAGGLSGCQIDTMLSYLYFTLPGQGVQGPYRLDRWELNDSSYTGQFQDINELVMLMNTLDPNANWERDSVAMTIKGGHPQNSYGALEITQLSTDMMGAFQLNTNYLPQGAQIVLAAGQHELIFRDTATNCTDTLQVLVDCIECPQIAAVGDGIVYTDDCDGQGAFCFTGADSLDLGIFDITLNGNPYTGTINNCPNLILGFQLSLDTGRHEIRFNNDTLDCEFIFQLTVSCEQPIIPMDTMRIDTTITIGEVDTICFAELLMLDSIHSLTTTCEGQSPAVGFEINNLTNCLVFEGINLGMDTICLAVCEDDTTCTEVIITVTVVDSMDMDTSCMLFPVSSATIQLEDCDTSGLFCLDILKSELTNYSLQINGMPFTDIYADCDVPEQGAISLPRGSYELILTENEGACADTAMLIVECAMMPPFEDSIKVNEVDTFCLDTVFTTIAIDTVYNACEASSGEMVVFTIAENCIIYTGIEVGIDTACVVACDSMGICDTAIVIITVEEEPDTIPFPIAVNDADTVEQGGIRTINVLGNDTTNSTLITVTIIDFPTNGTVLVNSDLTISYMANEVCDTTDFFTYELCNPRGCDTARVDIYIDCKVFKIYNGFSPNGDGVNDTFTIEGIEDFPNNEVRFYNRWGTLVFQQNGYKGQWDGTWNGKLLPDGTYYYLIDDGEGKSYSGFLEIKR